MTLSGTSRLASLLGAALATTAAVAPPAAAQSDQVPPAGGGAAAPALPQASPKVSGPSLRNTLESCMAFWDAETHMSKAEWRAACKRTVNGTNMDMEALGPAARESAGLGEGKAYRGRSKGARR